MESLSDIVNMSVQWIIKRSSQSSGSGGPLGYPPKNVLTQGYRLRDDRSSHNLSGATDVACHQLNSSVIELGNPQWQVLFERVGSGPMMYLLKHTSVFLQLRNRNYQQLCGTPITDMSMPQAQPIHMPAIDNILGESGDHSPVHKRKHSLDIGEHSTGNIDGRREGKRRKGSDEHSPTLSLTSIVINRSSMLYRAPRLTRPKSNTAEPKARLRRSIFWDLPKRFPAKAAFDPAQRETRTSVLLSEIFAHSPMLRTNPPLVVRDMVARLLKLHSKFDYRRQLFRWCPAPWQQEGEQFSMPNTQPDNLFDSDSDGDLPLSSSMLAMSQKPRRSGSSRKQKALHLSNVEASIPGSTGDSSASSFLDMATVHHDVFMFIQKCVQGVIPHGLIGGKRNHRRLYNVIHKVIEDGRFEVLTLHEVMQKFRISEVASWLSVKDPGSFDIYAGFIHWVLVDYVLALLRHFFYVTESAPYRYKLFYFRNDVWVNITRRAWRNLESSMYVKRSRESAVETDAGKPEIKYSRIRLLPKERGFRTIANLGRSEMVVREGSKLVEKAARPTNRKLADTLAALTSMRKADPKMMGASAYCFDDVLDRLKQFRARLGLSPGTSIGKLFMAKIDIHRAFDTIRHDKLLELLEQRLPDEEYAIYKYWMLSPSFGKYRVTFQRHGQRSSDPAEFGQLANSLAKRTRNVVYGDHCSTTYIDTQDALRIIRGHITGNLVRNSHGLWQQRVGIPQGSTVSSFLCNFFYAQLEREHLHDIIDDSALFMRMTDDFIIVSRHQATVIRFLERIMDGVPEYGAKLNKTKTLVNFEGTIKGEKVESSTSQWFPWCGLLINEQTLEIRSDYKRMMRANLRMTLTINAGKAAGTMFRQKMLAALRTKLVPILMDCKFNSRPIVLLNLYQHFLVCGMKLHTIYRQLPVKGRNSQYVVKVIWDFIRLAFVLLRSKCGFNDIPPADVTWLALCAFRRVLSQRQSRYPQVLARIRSAMGVPRYAKMAARHAEIIQSLENEDVLLINF
ncbi:Telomerase reverse transcriptase [Linderina pennispora]|nr:Telomerase reverse transcriptase [Linderina pennispora]